MSKCSLILCEKTGAWAAALRAIAPPQAVDIVETRGLPAADAALAQAGASVLALQITADNMTSIVDFWLETAVQYPRARMVGLADAGNAAGAVVLREAGAIDVICSVLDLPRLSRLADRQAARTPRREVSIGEWTSARMPWKALATSQAGLKHEFSSHFVASHDRCYDRRSRARRR